VIETFSIDDQLAIPRTSGGMDYIVRGCAKKEFILDDHSSCFGMVTAGSLALNGVFGPGEVVAGPGTYFAFPKGSIFPRAGCSALLIVCGRYTALPMLGALEDSGRLRYVDGCSDTLLISPPRLGDPCLNHLHMPAGTNQRMHFHPSDRVGVVLRGNGECRTEDETVSLAAGQGWLISEGAQHCFRPEGSAMDVIAWHPDSDYGPTDENHPMINRTWTRPT